MIMRFALTACLALSASLSAAQELPFGTFYGGYSLDVRSTKPADFSLDLDHVDGMTTGSAAISIFWMAVGKDCPTGFDDDFCRELLATVPAPGDTKPPLKPETLGVLIESQEAFIAFRIGSKGVPHVLILRREGGDVSARVIHRDRGTVAEAPVAQRSHLCEQAMCIGGRLERLAADPQTAFGVFRDPQAFMAQFSDANLSATDKAQPVDRLPLLRGEWEVLAANAESLGTIGLTLQDDKVFGNGTLMDHAVEGRPLSVLVRDVAITNDGAQLQVTFDAGGNGAKHVVPLLLTLPDSPGGSMRGSLRQGERFELVTLRFVASYQGGFAPPKEPETTPQYPPASRSSTLGATAWSYDLAGVPTGKRLTMREAPSPDAKRTGALISGQRGLLLIGCTPGIEASEFDRSDQKTRAAMLASRWCEVRDAEGHQRGYVKGRYLVPAAQ